MENTKDLNSTIKGKKDNKYTKTIGNTLRPEFRIMKRLVCHQRCSLQCGRSYLHSEKSSQYEN